MHTVADLRPRAALASHRRAGRHVHRLVVLRVQQASAFRSGRSHRHRDQHSQHQRKPRGLQCLRWNASASVSLLSSGTKVN